MKKTASALLLGTITLSVILLCASILIARYWLSTTEKTLLDFIQVLKKGVAVPLAKVLGNLNSEVGFVRVLHPYQTELVRAHGDSIVDEEVYKKVNTELKRLGTYGDLMSEIDWALVKVPKKGMNLRIEEISDPRIRLGSVGGKCFAYQEVWMKKAALLEYPFGFALEFSNLPR